MNKIDVTKPMKLKNGWSVHLEFDRGENSGHEYRYIGHCLHPTRPSEKALALDIMFDEYGKSDRCGADSIVVNYELPYYIPLDYNDVKDGCIFRKKTPIGDYATTVPVRIDSDGIYVIDLTGIIKFSWKALMDSEFEYKRFNTPSSANWRKCHKTRPS